jgi:carbon storage regulator
MLVLTRKRGEKVIVGDAITVTVVAVSGNHVRIGIDAPQQIRILRGELADEWDESARSLKQVTVDLQESLA